MNPTFAPAHSNGFSMEGNVFICRWSKSDDGFEIWVKSKPQIRAKGKSFDQVEEALLTAIADHTGDFEPVLEFVPPLPKNEFDQKFARPEVFELCGDERFATDEPRRTSFETEEERVKREAWYDDFFLKPCCPECRTPGGPRSKRSLTLMRVRGGYDGGFLSFSRTIRYIFSEKFLALLSAEELQRLEFRPVVRAQKGRKRFFELIGPSGPPEVAVAGLEFGGWRCEACCACCFGYESIESFIHDFVARSDLSQPLPEVFTIGVQPQVKLCVTAERWARMVGQPGTHGIVSHLIGVVPDNELLRTPELMTLQEQRERYEAERAAARGE